MAHEDSGVLQLENGFWEYRFTMVVDGRKVSSRKRKDEEGNPLKTKKAALKARKEAMKRAQNARQTEGPPRSVTVTQIYDEYCEKGRSGKAYGTILKQDSLWKNHLKERFGNRRIGEISVAEIDDYLTELYYVKDYSYQYVGSFLKMFYLIFGQAYSRNYLSAEAYSKLCTNKGTRIQMPKRKVDEEDEVIVFSPEELEKLDDYFAGSNAETAYLLGRYCGLRINECYGIRWENVDLEQGTILIDRQMQYQKGLIKLVPLKTRNARRTVYMNEKLKVHFQKLAADREQAEAELAAQRIQNQTFLTDLDGKPISSLAMVNTLPNGKLQTLNSMKYHAKTIKEKLGIRFKYHFLRHTYGTRMAEMNTPAHLLCNQMGHGNIQVTQKYYIAVSRTGLEILKGNLNRM